VFHIAGFEELKPSSLVPSKASGGGEIAGTKHEPAAAIFVTPDETYLTNQ